jgi:ABC-2 type transport system permease protein
MSTVWLLMKREFSVRVRGRGYLIYTIVGVLAIVGLAFVPAIIDAMTSGSQVTLAVVDETSINSADGLFFERMQAELADLLPNGEARYKLTASDASGNDLDAQVNDGDLDAYVVISPASDSTGQPTELRYTARLVSKETVPDQELARLSSALNAAAAYIRFERLGMGEQEVAGLFSPVETQTQTLSAAGEASETERAESYALTYVLVFLLYLTVLLYGSYVAMGVIEEKSSRVIEILVSKVRPYQLMAGKLLGVGLTALLQYGIWVAAGIVVMVLGNVTGGLKLGGLELHLSAVSPGVLAWFVVFFVLGFFTYSAVFAGLGSMVSRAEDAQQATTPVMFPLVAVFIIAIMAMSSPDALFVHALSFVPFASPILMFVRIAMSDPPLWEVLAAVAVNLVTIMALVWGAAKVFRASILLYGRRVGVKTVLRALR